MSEQSTRTAPVSEAVKRLEVEEPKASLPAGWGLAVCIGLYLVVLPNVNVWPDGELYDAKRLVQVALLMGHALVVAAWAPARAAWLAVWQEIPRPARWGCGGLLAVGLLSSLLAAHPRYALLEVAHLTLLAVLALGVACWVRRAPLATSRYYVGFVALAAALYLLAFAVVHVDNLITSGTRLWPAHSHIGFRHIRFFNQMQTLTLPLLAVPILWARRPWAKGAALVLLAGWWMLLVASGGRGTAVALLGALVLVPLVLRRRALGWLGWQLAGIVLGLALYGILFAWLPSAESVAVTLPGTEAGLLTRDLSASNSRLLYLQDAWTLVQAHPLLGAGPMHYADAALGMRAAHPHNALAQWAAEWGVPAALVLLGLVGWGLVAFMRHSLGGTHRAAEPLGAVRVALLACLVAGAAHSLLSGLLVMPVAQTLLALVAGWCLGLVQHERVPQSTEHGAGSGWRRTVLIVVLMAAVGLVGWGAGTDAVRLVERQQAYLEQEGARWLLPRYWQQGFIGETLHADSPAERP